MGLAPRERTISMWAGLSMERMVRPFMSLGERTSRLLLVKLRKPPLSQMPITRMPVCLRMSSNSA